MPDASVLTNLGWDAWFEAQRRDLGIDANAIARVAAVDRDQLILLTDAGSLRAKLSGKYLFESDSAAARPCVGDWVCAELSESGGPALIHRLLPRKTCLRRKLAGDSVEYQMIAANVDFVIVVQSCHYDFNLKRLERYLVMVWDGGATPVILLTKTDLVTAEVLSDQIGQIRHAGISENVVMLSNLTGEGFDELSAILQPGKTYCFVGSSGVGKSTIINRLAGSRRQETREVSGTGEGRHTTVRRELIILENGALVIDSPGMREFGIVGATDGIETGFADIMALASQCKFRDCTHTTEPGCAVVQALEQGEIDAEHFNHFAKLKRESDHHMLTYAEKRKKDRDFGRFIKSVKKDLEQE